MIQPEELKNDEPLKWSPGNGADVWALFCACQSGDLATVKRLVAKAPSLVRSHHAYRTPHLLRRAGESNRSRCLSARAWRRSAQSGGERQPSRYLPRSGYAADGEAAGGTSRDDVACAHPERGIRRRGDPRAQYGKSAATCLMPRPELLHAGDRAIQSANSLGSDDATD